MYFLLEMGIFQPAMLVYQRVPPVFPKANPVVPSMPWRLTKGAIRDALDEAGFTNVGIMARGT